MSQEAPVKQHIPLDSFKPSIKWNLITPLTSPIYLDYPFIYSVPSRRQGLWLDWSQKWSFLFPLLNLSHARNTTEREKKMPKLLFPFFLSFWTQLCCLLFNDRPGQMIDSAIASRPPLQTYKDFFFLEYKKNSHFIKLTVTWRVP